MFYSSVRYFVIFAIFCLTHLFMWCGNKTTASLCEYDVLCWLESHDDVIKWKHIPRYWPLCGEFTGHRQWRGALMFSLICAWINGWVNNREAGDLRRHRAHYDVIVMLCEMSSIARGLNKMAAILSTLIQKDFLFKLCIWIQFAHVFVNLCCRNIISFYFLHATQVYPYYLGLLHGTGAVAAMLSPPMRHNHNKTLHSASGVFISWV